MARIRIPFHVLLVLDNIDTPYIQAKPGQFICIDTNSGGYPWVCDEPEFFSDRSLEAHQKTFGDLILAGKVKIATVLLGV